jgi:hypothetical protein
VATGRAAVAIDLTAAGGAPGAGIAGPGSRPFHPDMAGTAGRRRAFVLAKAEGDAAVAAGSVARLRRCIELLFRAPRSEERSHADHG